jgi:energy-coupling factor transport system permease protein
MNPRAVSAWSFAALTVALATSNPIYRALVLLCALDVLVAFRRRGTHIRGLLLAVTIAGIVALAITLLFSHTGTHVLLRLPDAIPALGGPITVETLVFGTTTALGIAAAIIAGAALSIVVEPHELIDALPGVLARSGAALGTALNLIPGVARSAIEIRDAQRMRGWRPARVRDWPDIAVPVVLTAIESSMTLAESMEARGYGAATRTHFSVSAWRTADSIVTVCSLAAAGTFVALRIIGVVGDWYPFPTVTVPPVNVLAACCCLALAAPLLVWRR